MEFSDDAIILGSRKHGETSVIVEVLTPNHGRCLGLVRGGRSSSMRPVLQAGNRVTLSWRARLSEHLGQFKVEPLVSRAAYLMASRLGLYTMQTLACHLRMLAEREPHEAIYPFVDLILDNATNADILPLLMVRFELLLLEELGFGLDLTRCIQTGTRQNVIWVSPKTGCAVSKSAGRPWASKLLTLPEFLQPTALEQETHDLTWPQFSKGFELTGFFLQKNIYGARGITMPMEREALVKLLAGHLDQ